MINIVKQKIDVDIELKKKIDFICEFCNTTPTFINGSIRNIDKTNINYIEPHKVIIKDKFKVNFFFDENGTSFEELVIEIFEERLNEIIEKYNEKNYSSLSNIDKNNTEKVEN